MYSIRSENFSALNLIKTGLGSKWAVFLCLLLAVVNKIIIAGLFTDLEGDKALYLIFSKSLLEGHSLLEPIKIAGEEDIFYTFNPLTHYLYI